MECLFCKINTNEIPAYTLYEDNVVRVIMDAFPNTKGHCLIITKDHFSDIYTTPNEILNHMTKIFKEISPTIQKVLKADGITMYENYGLHQEIKHIHLHLLPVYKNQSGLEFLKQGKQKDVEKTYKLIKNELS